MTGYFGPEVAPQAGGMFGDKGLTFGTGKGAKGAGGGQGTGIGVNAYLWRGALDTLSFMPLASADPFGGTIITDWYTPPGTEGSDSRPPPTSWPRTALRRAARVDLPPDLARRPVDRCPGQPHHHRRHRKQDPRPSPQTPRRPGRESVGDALGVSPSPNPSRKGRGKVRSTSLSTSPPLAGGVRGGVPSPPKFTAGAPALRSAAHPPSCRPTLRRHGARPPCGPRG